MIRRLAWTLAAVLLLGGLLVGGGSTVAYGGETTTCTGPIVRAESLTGAETAPSGAVELGLMRECERSDGQRLRLAALGALLAFAAGSVGVFSSEASEGDVVKDAVAYG